MVPFNESSLHPGSRNPSVSIVVINNGVAVGISDLDNKFTCTFPFWPLFLSGFSSIPQ